MNEELQKTLSEILEKSVQLAENTGEWALDMAPKLIEQYLAWEFYSALFFVVNAILIVVLGILFLKFTKKQDWWSKQYYGEERVCSYVISFLLWGIGLVVMFANIYKMVFITVAPEIYLIKTLLY